MPTHYGHTPGSFNADTIRRLATPSAVQRARGTTDLSAGRDPFAGRTLLSSGGSAGGAAVATGRTGTPAFGNAAVGRTLLNSATSRARQSSSTSGAGVPWWDQPDTIGRQSQTPNVDQLHAEFRQRRYGAERAYNTRLQAEVQESLRNNYRAPANAEYDPERGVWVGRDGFNTVIYTRGPNGETAPRQATDPSAGSAPASEPFQFNTPAFGSGSSGSAPDIPQLGRITPYRSVAPDPGSSATLARPEAPNVDPLTLPEARQRTVANRSRDLSHLQSARSRRSVQGPRGSFNVADTARRTLLGSL